MRAWLEQLYQKSPTLLQHVMVSAYGWHWKNLRFGGQFYQELYSFRQREAFSESQWHNYATTALRSLLLSAFAEVPYYQDLLGSHLKREDLEAFELSMLPSLPILEKSVSRDYPQRLMVGGIPQSDHKIFPTSGSTGTPVDVYWRPEELQRSLALREARSNSFARVSFTLPRATFGGRIVEPDPDSSGPFYRYNLFEKQVYFSAFHLGTKTVGKYIDALKRHKTMWMTGYAHSIYQLADLALSQGLKPPTLRAVVTTSEKVTAEMRETIEQAFSTRLFEEYASVEELFYVCECEHSRKHINPDAGILEIVDEEFQPVPVGQIGEVLATGFIRPHQPMIRYRLGDLAALSDEKCPCGRAMPVLKEVIGRVEDTVYGPDGRRMVRFHGVFVDQPHVQEGQIVQRHLDDILVRIVPKPGFDAIDRSDIIQRIQQRLTERVSVSVEVVDHIQRTSAGKFQAVISELPTDQIQRLKS